MGESGALELQTVQGFIIPSTCLLVVTAALGGNISLEKPDKSGLSCVPCSAGAQKRPRWPGLLPVLAHCSCQLAGVGCLSCPQTPHPALGGLGMGGALSGRAGKLLGAPVGFLC